jgi:hypothetical protein
VRRGELERNIALESTKRDIAARIRRVCQNFRPEEFEELVMRMAEIDVRYRLRDEWANWRGAAAPVTPRMN